MTANIQQHLALLGMPVRDRVTNVRGVVTSICFDLYGCIQAVVNPGTDKDGKPQESGWYDVQRLEVAAKAPVMPQPDFDWSPKRVASGKKGPAEKPPMVQR